MSSCYYVYPEENLQLAGLISQGGRSHSIFYQMWFTEHHPDMCSIGPTECWLEHAVCLLSLDFEMKNISLGTSGYVLQNYAMHAVRDYIIDERNRLNAYDSHIRIYSVLDAVLGVSKTYEEGAWPRGELVFVESSQLDNVCFIARFPYPEQTLLKNFKHVRKLLQAVEHSPRKLVSQGKTILGIATGPVPRGSIISDFRGGHGFLKLNEACICSFFDGGFHSTTRQAKLVQVEEILLESELEAEARDALFKIIADIVHYAEKKKFGCTLVINLQQSRLAISGQHFENPLDLQQESNLKLACSLANIDGALQIESDLRLHGFACLLDGHAVKSEDHSRGARFNSALRFSAEHEGTIIVVVSSDRPVSVIQGGIELTAQCEWKPLSSFIVTPPTLEDYIQNALHECHTG
jgi:DNA integrity scanning protein DisA with diadenylate cyclase activity